MVLIALKREKILRLPLRSYHLYNRLSQFRFDTNAALDAAGDNGILLTNEQHRILTSQSEGSTILYRPRENRQQVEGDDPP